MNLYIKNNLLNEIHYFEKKYLFKINILTDDTLIIPEYRIELLNKSKKVIDKVEKVNKIRGVKKDLANEEVKKKSQTEKVINLNKSKKSKTLKKKD